MQHEKLIKSSQRVKEHGEVFTPRRVVKKMLDQPELVTALHSLTSTFLEPAAGEGAFLTEVLTRKLSLAGKLSVSIKDFEQNALTALTSLYGIELLTDNTEILINHMYQVFHQEYMSQIDRFDSVNNKKIEKSAVIILRANLVQGDALTGKNKNGEEIIFSQWNLVPSNTGIVRVERVEYTFESIKNDGPSLDGIHHGSKAEEMSLFDADNNDKIKYRYSVVPISDVYKELKTVV